jgi:DnaJ-class molecular chaperone
VSEPRDPYEVLQVASNADDAVVRAAYRALAQRYHPDIAGPGGESRMRDLNAAWEVLGDLEQRAAYDLARVAPGTGRSPDATAGTDPPGRRAPEPYVATRPAPPPAAPP